MLDLFLGGALMDVLGTASLGTEAAVRPWFEPDTFGSYYGAAMGAGGGILSGIVGALAGWLTPRGKGRGIVFGGMYVLLAVGLLNLAFGGVALALGQPYGIWYAGLLCGVLFTILPLTILPGLRKRYAQAEERRMEAADLRSA